MTKNAKCDINMKENLEPVLNGPIKKARKRADANGLNCQGKERKNMNKYMEIAKNKSIQGFKNKEGGPFGAVITDKDGNIIAEGNNRVLCSNDPTACEKLKTYDLSGYILYTSCEPCPMCLSAIIWANIKNVYYGCTKEDAGDIGFRDDVIYKYLKGENKDLINLKQEDRDECIKAFEEYKNKNGIIY